MWSIGKTIFLSFIILLIALPFAAANDSFTKEYTFENNVNLHSDGTCGRSNHGWIDDCNTQTFIATGPGGCYSSAVSTNGIGGCYFWQPADNPAVIAGTYITAPYASKGSLTIFTADYGGGTYLNEKVNVYVNRQYIGTTPDNYCNTPNCSFKGPVSTTFNNVAFLKGNNEIIIQAVNNGGSVTVTKYRIDATSTVPPNPQTPSCTSDFSPNVITKGQVTTGSLSTNNAKSLKINCNGDLGNQNLASVPLGYSNSGVVNPQNTQTCTTTVYAKENYQGNTAQCITTITVKESVPTPQPSCAVNFNPNVVTKGDLTTGSFVTSNARSIKVHCTGDLGNQSLTSVPLGYSDSQVLSPDNTQTCTATVYAKENYQGNTAQCASTITVKEPVPTPQPSCAVNFNPSEITKGQVTTGSLSTNNARSIKINCNGDLGNQNLASVPLGYSDSQVLSPDNTQTCTATVYAKENYQGNTAQCASTITVTTSQPKKLVITLNDVSVQENSGLHIGLQDLKYSTTVENIDPNTLVYTLVSESNPEIIDCALGQDINGKYTLVNCQTKQDKSGDSTVRVRVNGGGLQSEDTFVIHVIPIAHQTPSCDAEVTPTVVIKGNKAILTAETNNARSIIYYCGTSTGNKASIANGETFTTEFTPDISSRCLVEVYSQPSFAGEHTTCQSNAYTVKVPSEKEIDLEVPDMTVEEDSGLHVIDLSDYTEYTGNNNLVYTLLDQTNPEIIECTLNVNSLTCDTKNNVIGHTTLTVRVTDGNITDTDTFRITVTPVNDLPSATFIEGSICQGHATTLSIDANDVDGNIQEVKWDFGDGSGPAFGTSVNHVYAKKGAYNITVNITGDNPSDFITLAQNVQVQDCSVVKHKVSIISAYVDSGYGTNYDVFSPGDTVELYVKVKNLGSDNEDARIRATLPEVGLEEMTPLVKLREGEGKWRVITIELPYDISAGEHVIRLSTETRSAQETRYVAFTVQ